MNVSEALEKISKAIGVLTHQIRTENLTGMYSKNRLAEDLLLPIFKTVYKLPDLRNLNHDSSNYPGIDLADDRAGVAFQITTERGSGKIRQTLETFIGANLQRKYHRLIIAVLSPTGAKYSASTKRNWKQICGKKLRFDPDKDILKSPHALFPLIEQVSPNEIFDICEIVNASVIGESYVNLEECLRQQSHSQLDYEKKTAKYIPEVFVENPPIKDLARTFSHPTLFFRRTLDELRRVGLPQYSMLLVKVGLSPLRLPELSTYSKATLHETISAASALKSELLILDRELEVFEKISLKRPLPFAIKPEKQYIFDELFYSIQSAPWGLRSNIEEIINQLTVLISRVFILTDKAGQGKTNFVCDFVENFLAKHNIPCAYLSGRRLSQMQGQDFAEYINRQLFDGRTKSFSAAARLLSEHTKKINRPIIIVIDGLNEHHDINTFSTQLEYFIHDVLQFPQIKFLLTCRSEFFSERFENVIRSSFSEQIFRYDPTALKDHRGEMMPHLLPGHRMLEGYFKFFKLNTDLISHAVKAELAQDTLLLRFFCEAYGARGKQRNYEQPKIAHIYREEIFSIYLKEKLANAADVLRRMNGVIPTQSPRETLLSVLQHIIRRMLADWRFGDIPESTVPSELRQALNVLLDEDVILRRDLATQQSIFAPSQDIINFTFDEFRDFLIADYLMGIVFQKDEKEFLNYVAKTDPKNSQIAEGIKKFLFRASRHSKNVKFAAFFRQQQWYEDAYIPEIFHIEDSLITKEDRDKVAGILSGGGERAQIAARILSNRWKSKDYSMLNLELLLSILRKANDSLYATLVEANFHLDYWGSENHVNLLWIFFENFKGIEVRPDSPEISLVEFLIFLFPITNRGELESPAVQMFRGLNLEPAFAMETLEKSLQSRITVHKVFVWRLLAELSEIVAPKGALVALAAYEVKTEISYNLKRELERFLARVNPQKNPFEIRYGTTN